MPRSIYRQAGANSIAPGQFSLSIFGGTLICALNDARGEVVIASPASNVSNVAVGRANVLGSTGYILRPGERIKLKTTAAIYARAVSGTPVVGVTAAADREFGPLTSQGGGGTPIPSEEVPSDVDSRVPQTLLPISDDLNADGWTAPAWSKLNDASNAVGSRAISPATAGPSVLRVTLASGIDPRQSSGHSIVFSKAKLSAIGGGSPSEVNLALETKLKLADGTVILTDSRAIATDFATVTVNLSAGEADAITNYDGLMLEFTQTADDSGDSVVLGFAKLLIV